MRQELELELLMEWSANHEVLAPHVREALKRHPLMDEDLAIGLNVSQNVLKNAMAIVINRSLPQTPAYFIELATRLACYAITGLPADAQEHAAVMVKDALLNKLADMQAAGNVLPTEWE